jgi:methionine aminopeptidase
MPHRVNLHVIRQTFFVGDCDEDAHRLVKCAFDCLAGALELCRPGTMYRDVGNTIQKVRGWFLYGVCGTESLGT